MTGVNYLLYRRSQVADLRHQISQDLGNISRSIETVVEERLAALRLLSGETELDSLDSDQLRASFENLRVSFGGFIDLGLIDMEGRQVLYTGPYNLTGHNYREEDWFNEVLLREVYVSDVFMGHRQLPHFVVVVRRDDYLLRATVDMQLLNRQVYISTMRPLDDVFLINRNGNLQTDSRFHGRILNTCTLDVPPYALTSQIIETTDESNNRFLLGYSYIKNTPFVLMVVRKPTNLLAEWFVNSVEIVFFLFVSTVLVVIVVLWSLTATVRQIRAADLERIRMLQNVEYTSKMATIGRLSASVAHEINNPLAIINEKAGLLHDFVHASEEYPQREKTLKALDSIIKSVERCGAVTHRLLGFTRRLKLRQEVVDLPSLITEVLGFLEKEAMHRSIQMETDFESDLPQIVSDRGQLEEVILNLLNNAFAAVEDGGKIKLAARSESQKILISVEDNGCGISEENLLHIFEPFFSTKGDFGTGLGLSITYDLVQKLGGEISVESSLGKGSSFKIMIPIAPAPAPERP
jgi:signal transduction histidine kinase